MSTSYVVNKYQRIKTLKNFSNTKYKTMENKIVIFMDQLTKIEYEVCLPLKAKDRHIRKILLHLEFA